VVRISNVNDWEEKKQDLCQPALFARRILLVLEEVGEKLAVEIWQERRLERDTSILYLLRDRPGKTWQSVSTVDVSLSDRQLLEGLIKRCGKTIHSQALGRLVRLWKEYDLKAGDIEQWAGQINREGPIQVQDVESHFEKSEKVLLFGFLDAVSEKNIDTAQRLFAGLMKLGYPPTLLLSNLARRFRLILQALETKEKEKDLWKGTKLSPFEFSKIQKTANNYDSEHISEIFRVFSQVDRHTKSQNIPFEVLMLDFFTALPFGKGLT